MRADLIYMLVQRFLDLHDRSEDGRQKLLHLWARMQLVTPLRTTQRLQLVKTATYNLQTMLTS